jgi:hypothetical protein
MPVPVGINLNPYPCPSDFLSAGTRIFCDRCHLYSRPAVHRRTPRHAMVTGEAPYRHPPHGRLPRRTGIGKRTAAPTGREPAVSAPRAGARAWRGPGPAHQLSPAASASRPRSRGGGQPDQRPRPRPRGLGAGCRSSAPRN